MAWIVRAVLNLVNASTPKKTTENCEKTAFSSCQAQKTAIFAIISPKIDVKNPGFWAFSASKRLGGNT